MNWKTDLKLSDLDATTRLELTCKRCGLTYYTKAGELRARYDLAQAYLDEAERALRCSDRVCKGKVRLALVHDDKTEGFVGGMA
jgi:transcription elongation factor Elf1